MAVYWDEEVCPEQDRKLSKWFKELGDRNLNFDKSRSVTHTFVDASCQAYGAVVYIRNPEDECAKSNMVWSKNKIVPLKTVSVPRLELMAAVLGMKLTQTICRALEYDMRKTVLWSDSLNVLYWIRNQSRLFKPFVANR